MKKIVLSAIGVLAVAILGFWLVYLPWNVARAVRHAAETTPASMGVKYEDVAFPTKGGGLTIRAWWMPADNARAILIFAHGASGNRRDFYARELEISKFLVSQHISVLAIDLRNHGTSDSTPNGRLTMGYDEANDAIGGIDYATARAPGLPVYLMGASMGGAVVIYAAARDARVQKAVLIDPVLDPRPTELNGLHAMLGGPRWFLKPILWSAETFFPGDPGFHKPLVTAETLKLPVLLIQDDRDPICPPARAAELAAHNPHVTLWVSHDPPLPPGANGGWGDHTDAYAINAAAVQQQLTKFLGTN